MNKGKTTRRYRTHFTTGDIEVQKYTVPRVMVHRFNDLDTYDSLPHQDRSLVGMLPVLDLAGEGVKVPLHIKGIGVCTASLRMRVSALSQSLELSIYDFTRGKE